MYNETLKDPVAEKTLSRLDIMMISRKAGEFEYYRPQTERLINFMAFFKQIRPQIEMNRWEKILEQIHSRAENVDSAFESLQKMAMELEKSGSAEPEDILKTL